jgi:curli biogenesis system outer membrane secretion channel CsgG
MRAPHLLLAVGLLAGLPASSAGEDRPQLAIVAFDAMPSGWTLPPPHIGETVAELMLDQLGSHGIYQIVDGQWLEPAGQGSRDEAAMARLLTSAERSGVDYIVLGSITRFSNEKRHRRLGVAAFVLPLLGGGVRERHELVVSLMARIVEVRAGRVVATATADGASARTRRSLGGLAPFRGGGMGGFSSGSASAREALLAEATRAAVAEAARQLMERAPALPAVERGPGGKAEKPCPPDVCVS